MRVLVTGAGGFVGQALVQRLLRQPNTHVLAASRQKNPLQHPDLSTVAVHDLTPQTDWSDALQGTDVVVHLAARVHMMNDRSTDPLAEFRRVNVAASLNLARQAAVAGVKRFVYISSIKVNGESTVPGHRFRADDPPDPRDPYGLSKHEAEVGLRRLQSESQLEVTVVRPPLVYGPGVGANFRSMMGWINRGIPLPFGAIDNRRSLVAIDNLCDLICCCLTHPAACGATFLVSDGEDLATPALLRRLGQALGRPARLLSVPQPALLGLLSLLGQAEKARRLCSSLQVDIGPARDLLGWHPPVSVDQALEQTAQAYLRAVAADAARRRPALR